MGSEIEDNRKKSTLPNTLKRKDRDTHLPHPLLTYCQQLPYNHFLNFS